MGREIIVNFFTRHWILDIFIKVIIFERKVLHYHSAWRDDRTHENLLILISFCHPWTHQDEAYSELRDIELNDPDAKSTVKELLSKWPIPLLITTLLAIFQQLSGHTNVLNFTADIFEVSGFEGPAPAVLLGFVKVVATVLAILWVRSRAYC